MICPFQSNSNLYPCIDGCALKVNGQCAIAILAQSALSNRQEKSNEQLTKP